MLKKIITSATLFALPAIVYGQGLFDADADFQTTNSNILGFINGVLVPLVFGLALIFFLWGVLLAFVIKRDEDSRSEGKQYMVWAIVGLVVMVSLWGIVNLLAGALGLEGENLDRLPETPTTYIGEFVA